ncbi:uncharacterized protein LOC143625894 [Bidens hawaiensis]|uniref:uncharacterized protein LOC143625894 n=1 Tax=Bidens hawaiensis TaxID=980011 RepID=UPI00404AC991
MTTPWTTETSWTLSRGSLDSIVTFESFDFPIDSESTTTRKPPLLLLPPSPTDYEPCEIKLNFTQKHEILQVYVRSTARVYEIYYAPDLQSDNEYLCTVRCSAASVDDNSFPLTDDWVEVKLPVGPDQKPNSGRIHQDFYEATAEINDSEPCMSLTIRLLSLQTKGCVYVDEVYVFADPIDPSVDLVSQTANPETSASSSLMTMLVPTLLGLAKSRSVHLPDQNSSNHVVKHVKTELEPSDAKTELTPSHLRTSQLIKTELEPTSSNNSINHVRQKDETLRKPSEAKAELTQSQLPVLTPDKEFPYMRTEILLEQLVSRVSRIEDICMRFEENMLKPINTMEARLQRVEQQVELLAKCPESPMFSKREPDPTSTNENENDSRLCGEPELEKTVSFSSGDHEPPEDTFCDEKVEVSDVLESPKEKPKKTVSIDDALAAALAGFSSFTKSNDGLIVESIDTTHVSITDSEDEAEADSESLKETGPEFIMENDVGPVSSDVSFDEVAIGPTGNFSCPLSPHETDDQQESIEVVKMLTFDKTDILKHFPDQPQEVLESRVDFESPILEVKFASFDNGSLKSTLEALLTDDARPATDEVVLIEERVEPVSNLLMDLDGDDVAGPVTEPANNMMVDLEVDDAARPVTDEVVLIEEQFKPGSNLLVDFNGDDVSEGVQQDLSPVELKFLFASLI